MAGIRDLLELGLDFTPGIGDLKAAFYDAPREFSQGNKGMGILALASAIPIMGAPADILRGGMKAGRWFKPSAWKQVNAAPMSQELLVWMKPEQFLDYARAFRPDESVSYLSKIQDPNITTDMIRKKEGSYLENLKRDIAKNGIKEPLTIMVRDDGSRVLWDGAHRLAAMEDINKTTQKLYGGDKFHRAPIQFVDQTGRRMFPDAYKASLEDVRGAEQLNDIPFLVMGKDDKGLRIVGHEGRHRATVAHEQGVEAIPVRVMARDYTGIRWDQGDFDLPETILSEDGIVRPMFTTTERVPEQIRAARMARRRGVVDWNPSVVEAQRQKRRDEMWPIKAYHGSMRPQVEAFDRSKSLSANWHGKGTYLTTDPDEASSAYAALHGPDHGARFGREVGNLKERYIYAPRKELEDFFTKKLKWDMDEFNAAMGGEEGEQLGSALRRMYANIHMDDIEDQARRNLGLGFEDFGHVYPVRVRMQNPVVTTNRKLEDIPEQFLGETVFREEKAGELIDTLTKEVTDLTGDSDLAEELDRVLWKVAARNGGKLSASNIESVLRRKPFVYMMGHDKQPVVMDVLQSTYKKLGFDGIIMDPVADLGVGRVGKAHIVPFDDSQIRSEFAEFDKSYADLNDLLAGIAPAMAVPAGAYAYSKMRERGKRASA